MPARPGTARARPGTMSTRRAAALLVLAPAMLLAHCASCGEAGGQYLVGPTVGIVFPRGDLKTEARAGYSLGVTAGKMIDHRFAFGLDAAFTRFGTARLVFPGFETCEASLEDRTWRLSDLGMWGTFSPASSWPVRPVIRMRFALYMTWVDWDGGCFGIHDRHNRLAGGFGIGTGFAVWMSKHVRGTLIGAFNRFDRATEVSLFGPDYDYPPLDYWSLHCEVAYRLGSR